MDKLAFAKTWCYPALIKPKRELMLDGFSKQVISTVSQVLKKSEVAQHDEYDGQLSDPRLGTLASDGSPKRGGPQVPTKRHDSSKSLISGSATAPNDAAPLSPKS